MKIRMKTQDVAFPFRMGAGFPGDVNRNHPASIEPTLIDASAPPTAYGQAVLVDATTQGVRPLAAADQAGTLIYGVTVRPFPAQASTGGAYGGAAFGSAAPPVTGEIDVLRSGYIMAQLNTAVTNAVVKGGPVFIWVAATSGAHITGGFEPVANSTNTMALDTNKYTYNGTQDANGVVEICVNI